jgi:hypothetical protein
MLLDKLNFSNTAMMVLPREFINSCKVETIITAPVVNGIATTATDILKQDLTNFLLTIQLAADSTHMDDLTRTDNDVTWITNGILQITSFHTPNNASTTCVKILASRRIVFSSACDWNLIMTADNHLYNGKCYATNDAFNIEINLYSKRFILRSR